MENVLEKINTFIDENESNKKQVSDIDKKVTSLNKEISKKEHSLEVSQNAIELLRTVSDKKIKASYEYLEKTINETLARIYEGRIRQIHIHETLAKNQYPQVELELTTEIGTIDLIEDGHGINQIISLLATLCLITITGSRRFMALDEVLSGLGKEARKVVESILWDFTSIGFQFVIIEHNFLIKGSKVYEIDVNDGKSFVKDEYIEETGIYDEQEEKERKVVDKKEKRKRAVVNEQEKE